MIKDEKDYITVWGIFDTISKEVRNSISKCAESGKTLGIGVYSDECCDTKLFTHPDKPLEHRMQIAQGLSGVTFVFPVDSLNDYENEKAAEIAYREYLNHKDSLNKSKKYKVGFVIGSFDVLHPGHIENINLSSEICEILYAVVKTDERVFDRKNKYPIQNTTERAANLRALKNVDGVLFYDLDSTRVDIVRSVISQFKKEHPTETIEEKDLVAIFGDDLKEKEEQRKRNGDWGEVNIEFTPRPEEKMKVMSSSVYQALIRQRGGIARYESEERKHLVINGYGIPNQGTSDGEREL